MSYLSQACSNGDLLQSGLRHFLDPFIKNLYDAKWFQHQFLEYSVQ